MKSIPILTGFACIALGLFASPVHAEWWPSFDVGSSSQLATHIVVVDGKGVVLESWRGDLKKGDQLPFPKGEKPIKVHYHEFYPTVALPGVKDVKHVTGNHRVLFLMRSKAEKGWTPANINQPDIQLATVWIEDDKAFAIYQPQNPGPKSQMHPLYVTKSGLKKQIEEVLRKPDPQPEPKEEFDLSGDWRLLLPAGYEYEVTLAKADQGGYRLMGRGLTVRGDYRLEGGGLVSVETQDRNGQFIWKVNSPYLLTLTKQTASVGSDYTGAVLFRKRDLPMEKTKGE